MKNPRSTEYLSSAREAKEFLATRIIREAQLQDVPLSEIEQKMLYFTESGWTLPHMMEIAEKFDEEYDQGEYEKKMTKLAKSAAKRAKETPGDEYRRWLDAIRLLSSEDHYISVFVGTFGSSKRPPFDLLKLWGTGFAIVAAFMSVSFPVIKYENSPAGRRFLFGTAVCVAAVCLLAWLLFRSRIDSWFADLVTRMMGLPDIDKHHAEKKPSLER